MGITVISFLTAIAALGIPNLVMSHMVVNSIQRHPELLDNPDFRTISSSRINIILEEEQLSQRQKILVFLANLYKGFDVFSIISLTILVELLFHVFGYATTSFFVGLGVLSLLFVLHVLNFFRTFKRDYMYLCKPF